MFLSVDYLGRWVQVVRIVNGQQCTIQALNSDVILHVPEGVHGAVLANIHTDPTRFIKNIPKDDCLVSPICEYHLEPSLGRKPSTGKNYKIQIPHIVADVDKVRDHLRVYRGNLHGDDSLEELKMIKQKGRLQ